MATEHVGAGVTPTGAIGGVMLATAGPVLGELLTNDQFIGAVCTFLVALSTVAYQYAAYLRVQREALEHKVKTEDSDSGAT